MTSQRVILIAGDVVSVAVVTLAGFATHGELGSAGARLLTTFVPVLAGWLLAAPWLGLFRVEVTRRPVELWRVPVAMLMAGPFAVVLRGLWLNAPIIPVFAVVLTATGAFALLIWRAVWLGLSRLVERGQVRDG